MNEEMSDVSNTSIYDYFCLQIVFAPHSNTENAKSSFCIILSHDTSVF